MRKQIAAVLVVAICLAIAGLAPAIALIVMPVGLLLGLAAIFNRPGGPSAWTWRGAFAALGYLGWLFVCFLIWVAAHTGGGGLDGPCEPGAQEHSGTCRVEAAAWPPLSSRVVIDGPDGHFEVIYPSTVDVIVIASLALLPLALWPAARWVTNPQRQGRVPLQRLAILVISATGLSLAYSAVVDDGTSRPLTAEEAAELRDESGLSSRVPAPQPTVERVRPTQVDVAAVEGVVSAQRGGGSTDCATATPTGIGLWTCTTETSDGSKFPARVTVVNSGSFAGKFVGHDGREHPFRGCCVAIHP
jgi:hypothetical protein